MGDFRVRYGLAYGPYGNVAYTSGALQFPIDDSTPDVTDGSFFLSNNTGATTITYFDVRTPGGGVSLDHQGKEFTLLINDNLTTIANAGNIFLPGTNAVLTSGSVLEFIFYNSAWYGHSYSENIRGEGQVQAVTVTGTGAPSIRGANTLILTGSGGTTSVITGLSGGYPGQVVTLFKTAAAVITDTALRINQTTDLYLSGGTATFVMDGSRGYTFVCDVAPRFRLTSPIVVP